MPYASDISTANSRLAVSENETMINISLTMTIGTPFCVEVWEHFTTIRVNSR